MLNFTEVRPTYEQRTALKRLRSRYPQKKRFHINKNLVAYHRQTMWGGYWLYCFKNSAIR